MKHMNELELITTFVQMMVDLADHETEAFETFADFFPAYKKQLYGVLTLQLEDVEIQEMEKACVEHSRMWAELAEAIGNRPMPF